jgi:hypothetical protein
MPNKTEVRLLWGNDTITIKGRNAGIEHLTVYFDDERLNIVDFLNHSLKAEYAATSETIMAKYEAKLKSGSIFDHDFPEAQFACKKIDATEYKPVQPLNDKKLIEALLKEYHICFDDLKDHFKEYESHMEKWFNSLSIEIKKR